MKRKRHEIRGRKGVWPGLGKRPILSAAVAILLGACVILGLAYRDGHHVPERTATAVAPPSAPGVPKGAGRGEEPHLVYEEAAPALASPEGLEHKTVPQGSALELALKPVEGPKPQWLQNANPMPDVRGKTMLALVIDDVGVDRRRSERAVAHLPANVTMSYLPYAGEVARQVQQARALGHEIIVHVPMEPESATIDPGPHALRVKDDAARIESNLDWDLAQFGGYVGINNHMGSKFTRDADGMRTVLTDLRGRGLFFLDSRTTPTSVGPRLARAIGLPHLERDVFLDNVETQAAVAAQLAEFERVARRYGYAIAIGHPHDATLDALEPWTREVQARGFVLVPLSTIMRVRIAADMLRAQVEAGK